MKRKRIIKKILIFAAWMVVGSGLILLLAAANSRKNEVVCHKVSISITSDGEKMFVDKNQIGQQLKKFANGSLVNRPIADINLASLERKLEQHSWIRDAELYFDSRNVLHVVISERQPVARVFTLSGGSFYIDSAGQRMPILDRAAIRVPLITSFPSAKKLKLADSVLLKDVKNLVQFINADPFWSAQIAQVDIVSANRFELIPVVGNHIIRIGTVENFREKLARLFLFYKQVLSKAGMNKYKVIDVSYKDQVIGMRSSATAAIDSMQLQKNIADLIARSKQQAFMDSLAAVQAFNEEARRDSSIKEVLYSLEEREALEADIVKTIKEPKKDTASAKPKIKNAAKPASAAPAIKKVVSNPIKTKEQSKPIEKTKTESKKAPQPKAVMKKKGT